MKITNMTAKMKGGDGVITYPDFAAVRIELEGGAEIEFVIHQSRCYQNTINVEIDGDFDQDDPALRINVNDNLIVDTLEGLEALPDSRKPDLDDEEVEVHEEYVFGPAPLTCAHCSRSIQDGEPALIVQSGETHLGAICAPCSPWPVLSYTGEHSHDFGDYSDVQ
jgi:hypothetical protein